jgi:tetratricopeptide (TPR) repeat protein
MRNVHFDAVQSNTLGTARSAVAVALWGSETSPALMVAQQIKMMGPSGKAIEGCGNREVVRWSLVAGGMPMNRRTYRNLQTGANIAVYACLLLLIGVVGSEAWKSLRPWQHITPVPPSSAQPGSPQQTPSAQSAPLTAEQRLELERTVDAAKATLLSDIRENEADERLILDRLVTLVGAFSAILALSAWFTLRYAREDALTQISRNEKDLKTFQDTIERNLKLFQETAERDLKLFRETAQRDLNAFKENTTTEMEGFTKRIWSELPEMRNLRERLRALLLDLERTLPAEGDWYAARSYEDLDHSQIQKILISEATANGLQVFISSESSANNETLANLFRAVARFYSAKFRKEKLPGDAERADIYLRKSIEIDPKNASAYAQRGGLYLSRNRVLEDSGKNDPMNASKCSNLLDQAEGFLREALKRDERQIGAAYNLAYVAAHRGSFDEAVEMLSKLAEKAPTLSYEQTKKYLPSIYANWACYLADQADTITGTEQDRMQLRERAIEVLEEGCKFLTTRGVGGTLTSLLESIARERKPTGDFKHFSQDQQARLTALLGQGSS